jgi:hypothetical protein
MSSPEGKLDRRAFLTSTVIGATAFGAASLLAGCGKKEEEETPEPEAELQARLGCCGKDCEACGKCAGCQVEGKAECAVRTCCMNNELANCRECPGKADCQKLADFAARSEMNKEAVSRLM